MKKIGKYLLVILFCVFLVGCSSKNSSVVGKYTYEDMFEIFMTFDFKKEVVDTIDIKIVYKDKEEASTSYKLFETDQKYADLKLSKNGLEITYKYSDDAMKEFEEFKKDDVLKYLETVSYEVIKK